MQQINYLQRLIRLQEEFLENQNYIVLSDTVGFIKDLPHTLIESFKATLSEAVNADLLIHVIDRSDCFMGAEIPRCH